MKNKLPNKLVVLAPTNFGGNTETANNNHFQSLDHAIQDLSEIAAEEHRKFVQQLISAKLDVLVLEDLATIKNPDALFLNNWFSIHDCTLVLYPMWAKSRRSEVQNRHIEELKKEFQIEEIKDYTSFAEQGQYCEGTGSIIFDELTKHAFACESERTSIPLFEKIVKELGYKPVSFEATDVLNRPIYHTNVMLSIGATIAVICSESINNPIERKMMLKSLEHPDRLLIDISHQQMNHFCANVIEVLNQQDERFLLMSTQAFNHFTEEQKELMASTVQLLHHPVNTIEQFGGGSVRCMVAGG